MYLVTHANIDMLTVNKLQKSSITRGGAKAGQNPLPFFVIPTAQSITVQYIVLFACSVGIYQT